MKKKTSKLNRPNRIVPSISTSSKTFVDRKTRSKHRRILNKECQEDSES